MTDSTGRRFREDLLAWAEENLRDFPWRERDQTLYQVFVAEFFLTQTPATNVAKVYPTFLERFPSLREIEEATLDEVEDVIKPLGFQRMRAEALSEIASRHEALPEDPEGLQKLPRVGPYVANATVCFARARRLPLLERNVVRAYERVFGDGFPESPKARREFAGEMLPEDGQTARVYNLALIDFGTLVCTKLDPHCTECFASDYCEYFSSLDERQPER